MAFFPLQSCNNTENGYSRYEITAEYSPDTQTVAGAVKVVFQNGTDNALSALKFELYGNAYREGALYSPIPLSERDAAYYKGASYGETSVSSVNGSKGWEVTGEDENILTVDLTETLYPGEKVVIDIGFLTKLPSVNHPTGVTEKTVNLAHFFPVLCGWKNGGFCETIYYDVGNPFFSEVADYKVRLTLPKEYAVVSTGDLVEERTLESKKAYTVSATNVRDFALVLSKNYRVLRATSGKTILTYAYYEDETPQATFDALLESFAYFERTFGAYPYERYVLAETGLSCGSAAYPCLSTVSDGITGGERVRAVVRETARQWWYAVVGSDRLENAWQEEGLAAYSTICFLDAYEKYGVKREDAVVEALENYRSCYDVYGSVLGRTDTRMTRGLAEYLNGYEYRCISRDKAVLLFDALRKSGGDRTFFAALRKYYARGRFRVASVGDLIGAFERVGMEANGLFEAFLNGKGNV